MLNNIVEFIPSFLNVNFRYTSPDNKESIVLTFDDIKIQSNWAILFHILL
jgi:hypothetical protein